MSTWSTYFVLRPVTKRKSSAGTVPSMSFRRAVSTGSTS
uniref:Uncharacterized protein n=1 Tax=Siphoviridae sp. ctBLh2 TaxID=2827803 RepID=A0A8S5S3L6_9CAUD|nr:MAG TPA: hypothetical protein [Siphoviridae sp. ctBLh2]